MLVFFAFYDGRSWPHRVPPDTIWRKSVILRERKNGGAGKKIAKTLQSANASN